MLTFGNVPGVGNELDQLHGQLPDVIECGENNDYWIQVRRSTKMIEFVSKQTGQMVAKASPTDPNIAVYGINPRQVDAAKAALRL